MNPPCLRCRGTRWVSGGFLEGSPTWRCYVCRLLVDAWTHEMMTAGRVRVIEPKGAQ